MEMMRTFEVRIQKAECGRSSSPAALEAFTVLELLFVITIVVVLAGLLFPAFRGVQVQAQKTQAKNDLTQIVTAVNAFYTEYGKYPITSVSTGDAYFGSGTTPSGSTSYGMNDVLLDVLRNNINGPTNSATVTSLNPRQIVFISPPEVKDSANPRSGIGTTTPSVGQLFDPWGTAYKIEIDGNYSDQIDTNPYSANAGSSPLQAGAIAWSLGNDRNGGSGNKRSGSNQDDVISWQ